MKKAILTFVATLLILIALTSCYLGFKDLQSKDLKISQLQSDLQHSQEKYLEISKKYTQIQDLLMVMTPEVFENEVASGKELFVYMGMPNCDDCSALESNLVKFLMEHPGVEKKLIFVNVRLHAQDAQKWKQLKEKFNIGGTPHFAKWSGGQQVSKTEWTKESGFNIKQLESWAKENQLT